MNPSIKPLRLAVVGTPHAGKRAFFRALINEYSRFDAWLDIHAAKRVGTFVYQDCQARVVHLPGVSALTRDLSNASLDVRITCEYLLAEQIDLLVNVIDGANLPGSLYLTSELLDMQKPMICTYDGTQASSGKAAPNMERLALQLGCPVIPLLDSHVRAALALQEYLAGQGCPKPGTAPSDIGLIGEALDELATEAAWYLQEKSCRQARRVRHFLQPSALMRRILARQLPLESTAGCPNAMTLAMPSPRWLALRLLQGEEQALRMASEDLRSQAMALAMWLNDKLGDTVERLIQRTRETFVTQALADCRVSASSLGVSSPLPDAPVLAPPAHAHAGLA